MDNNKDTLNAETNRLIPLSKPLYPQPELDLEEIERAKEEMRKAEIERALAEKAAKDKEIASGYNFSVYGKAKIGSKILTAFIVIGSLALLAGLLLPIFI